MSIARAKHWVCAAILLACASVAVAPASAQEADEASESASESAPESTLGSPIAEITIASDYVDRGISGTAGLPTVQGLLGWEFNVPLSPTGVVEVANIAVEAEEEAEGKVNGTGFAAEVGFAAGVGQEFGPLGWEAALVYTAVPGLPISGKPDELELELGFSIGVPFAVIGAEFIYIPDNDFIYPDYQEEGDATALYYGLSLDMPMELPGFSLGATFGYQQALDRDAAELPSYINWSVALNYERDAYGFSFAYHDTDITSASCGDGSCDPRVVFSVFYSFF